MNYTKKFRRVLSAVLTFVMLGNVLPFHAFMKAHAYTTLASENNQAELEILQEIRLEREVNQGLVGFTGDYALPEDNRLLSVIVVFETAPAQVQMAEALEEGLALTHHEAVSNVEAAHDLFFQELDSLFGRARSLRSANYVIGQQYYNAINGVSLMIPANKVEEMATFSSVRAIFPDETVTLDPIDEELLGEAVARHVEEQADRNPPGMAPGRARMRADEMHASGYRGAGVLVAVIDTGIEYRHPAFLGAFPSLEDMHARGADHINENSLTWIGWVGAPGNADDRDPTFDPDFTGPFPGIPPGTNIPAHNYRNFQYDDEAIWYGNYRFLGRNVMEGFHSVIPEHDFPHYYPMETFPGTPVPPHSTASGFAGGTSHGTHVAGTIVGRDTGRANSILGVAPEAQMIAYRVLAQGGGSVTTVMRGIEWSYIDRADVVNMSLGGGSATTNAITGTAINNLMLSRNHQITFVLSAGNSGAGQNGFYTVTDPAPATKAITVAAFQEGGPLPRLAGFSSRGPILNSYEIKPDIGAHGVSVWSAHPRWSAVGYSSSSGTSMSAPHIAGAVALLIEFSRENDRQWCNEEIKVRLMNTAIRLEVPHWVAAQQTTANIRGSVFDTGAGQADIYAAAHAESFVFVDYDRVLLDPRYASFLDHFETHDFNANAFARTRTGSFSFGGVNRHLPDQVELDLDRTMMATITNRSNVAITYDIEVEWIDYDHPTNQNHEDNGVTLRTSHERITVPAGQSRNFSATLNIPITAAVGHYEGFINISANGQVVAVMPFAGVMAESPALLNSMSLYRPVISTGASAQNVTSSELGMNFIPQAGFATRAWIFENAEGLNRRNWMDDRFAEYLVGFAGSNELPMGQGDNFLFGGAANNPGPRLTAGQMHRAVIFDGQILPATEIFALHEAGRGTGNPALLSAMNFIHRGTEDANWELLEEGDYVIILEVYQAAFHNDWVWVFDTVFEFSVDNTPPELNDVSVNGTNVYDGAHITIEGSEATITGNVFDGWVAAAEAAGVTFDIWRTNALQREVSLQNNLAVFVQAEGEEAVRATVDASGNFEVELADLVGATTVSIFAIDNYSVIPAVDRLFSTIPVRNMPFLNIPGTNLPNSMGVGPRVLDYQDTFQIDGFLAADSTLNDDLMLAARLPYVASFAGAANASARNQHVWSGLNVTEMTMTVAVQEEAIISRLVIDQYEGIIDQEAATITFQIPTHFLQNGRYYGHIRSLEADEDTIFFWVENAEWPRQLGDFTGFGDGDLVYVADGRIYTIIIEAPAGVGLINHLRIGSVNSVINQEAATITFTVPRHLMVNDMFRGPITQLDADCDTLIFWVAGAEWPLVLGQTPGIHDGDLVYVAGGRVYTIRIIVR